MSNRFQEADQFAKEIGAYSYIIQISNNIVHSYGDITDTFNIASIRKPLLGALIGIRVNQGILNLNTTLEELHIDDIEPPLSKEEKQVTIKDILQFRSGVYHPANYETASMKDKPARGSFKHGEHWFYNNWDANVLGTIYRQLTNHDIFDDFNELIAKPIGMQDFDITKCEYKKDAIVSSHPAYIMRMTARDLATFGLLYLNYGAWNGNQIIPSEWIAESTKKYSITPDGYGFGYLWNISNNGYLYPHINLKKAFSFSGYPGHFLCIDPESDTVIVYEHDIDHPNKIVSNDQFGTFLKHVYDALASAPAI